MQQQRLKVQIAVTPAHASVLREYVDQQVARGGGTTGSLTDTQVCLFLLEIARAIEDTVVVERQAQIRYLSNQVRS